jgi:hypothetical protein
MAWGSGIRHTLDNIGKLRTDRMKAVVDKKSPKLAMWKKNDNAKSILVLEQNDIQLTNPSIVADTYLPLAKAMSDRAEVLFRAPMRSGYSRAMPRTPAPLPTAGV